MTIKQFHSGRRKHIRYVETAVSMNTSSEFYDEFLDAGKRLPAEEIVKQWNDLLVRYINDPTSKTFVVRKYSGGKENGVWNNRRGAVVQFSDGFEVVYADNFLAHEIYLMAWHGFVPNYDDFKNTIENRELHITSGTEVEKHIRLYPSASKKNKCYLAHIVDVNGQYVRDNGDYHEISSLEASRLYPLGVPGDWTNSPDKIYHLPYKLSNEEKELVKAHFLRFLNPLNHYVTPETKHCIHTLTNWPARKNIGEYAYLTYYVQERYKTLFGPEYAKFMKHGRFRQIPPTGYTGLEPINLEICFSKSGTAAGTSTTSTAPTYPKKKVAPSAVKTKTRKSVVLPELIFNPVNEQQFKNELLKNKKAHFRLTYTTGVTKNILWNAENFKTTSKLRGNIQSKTFWRNGKKEGLVKVEVFID